MKSEFDLVYYLCNVYFFFFFKEWRCIVSLFVAGGITGRDILFIPYSNNRK